MLCNWLSERLDHSLHVFQCTCLAHIVKVFVDNLNGKNSFAKYQNTKEKFGGKNLLCKRVRSNLPSS
jgi:hypothetical protein